MATGKERGFKDWKGSKEFRRSARNYTESDAIKGHPKGGKNTKKWCKGKKGRKHTLALYDKYTWSHNYKCLACGKEFWGKLKREDFLFEEKSIRDWAEYR